MEEKKIAYAYQVTVFENGDVEVNSTDAGRKLEPDEIFKDIRVVARKLEIKEVENAAYVGTIRAMTAIQKAANEAAVEK